MKITIDLEDSLLGALVTYYELTGVRVSDQIKEAVQDYVACTLTARLETIQERPLLLV